MIRTRGLTEHHVGVRAVDDRTSRTAPGRVTGVLGPDGRRQVDDDVQHAPDDPVTTTLRERVAAAPWRRRIAARRSLDHAYRVGVGAVGGVIVAVGLVTVPLPGPGWLTVIAGLLVLASEFAWAERRLAFTRRHVARWGHWLAHQPRAVRVAVAVATAAFTYAVAVVTLHVVGVPTWVPDAVPLWR